MDVMLNLVKSRDVLHFCVQQEGSPNWYGSGLENRRAMSLWGFESPTLRTWSNRALGAIEKLFTHYLEAQR